MSLDKAIEHGKEKRKPYYGTKEIDPTCRPHGSCPWCEENRQHKNKKRELAMSDFKLTQEMIGANNYELYDPEFCDGNPCPRDCDKCSIADEILEKKTMDYDKRDMTLDEAIAVIKEIMPKWERTNSGIAETVILQAVHDGATIHTAPFTGYEGGFIPDFDVAPVTRARWIDNDPTRTDTDWRKDGMAYYCSNCKHRAGKFKHKTYRYCPWSGAKMEET